MTVQHATSSGIAILLKRGLRSHPSPRVFNRDAADYWRLRRREISSAASATVASQMPLAGSLA